MLSSLLVGSHPEVPACPITVVANAASENLEVPAGAYYVDDPNLSRSACRQFALEIATHAQIATASCYIGEDRLSHLDTDVACTVTFTGDTTLRDLMGWTGNLTPSALNHDANGPSEYVWMPGRTEIPDARLGTQGLKHYDTKVGMSTTTNIVASQFNEWRENRFRWSHVLNDRVWTTAEGPGEWVTFFDRILRRFRRFKLYREMTDDSTSETDTGVSSSAPLGPYKMKPPRGTLRWEHDRDIPFVEHLHPIDLSVVQVLEYT